MKLYHDMPPPLVDACPQAWIGNRMQGREGNMCTSVAQVGNVYGMVSIGGDEMTYGGVIACRMW